MSIVAVGEKLPLWIKNAYQDYADRFPASERPQLKEIKPEGRESGKSIAQMKALEAGRILKAIGSQDVLIAMDEKGKAFTTQEFTTFIEKTEMNHPNLAFVIGGPDGLDDSLLARSFCQIRLSSMTLPHGLARVVLIEQIYRAHCIRTNHPYHRA